MIIYKQLIKKLHPDLNKEMDETAADKIALVLRYRNNDSVLRAYAKTWDIVLENESVDVNFRYPYPDCEFRVDDTVMCDGSTCKITDIRKKKTLNSDSVVYEFDLFRNIKSVGGADVSELKTVIRPDVQASKDPNFYLYTARWSKLV